MLLLLRAWVQSLVRKLRPHILRLGKKKEKRHFKKKKMYSKEYSMEVWCWSRETLSSHSPTRILECIAFPFSKGSSQPRDRTQVSCITGRFFTNWAIREAPFSHRHIKITTIYRVSMRMTWILVKISSITKSITKEPQQMGRRHRDAVKTLSPVGNTQTRG